MVQSYVNLLSVDVCIQTEAYPFYLTMECEGMQVVDRKTYRNRCRDDPAS